jgi:4-amino-4-deoxy-L-arabinose transferase-like glycosyltransferase
LARCSRCFLLPAGFFLRSAAEIDVHQRLQHPTLYLVLFVVLAGALRLWRLGSLPPSLYHDEAYNGLDALSLLTGSRFPRFYEGWELYTVDAYAKTPPRETQWPVFFEGNYGREPLHIYLMALAISLFGPTPFAIRLVPALSGVGAVLTTYLAATSLLPRRWRPGAPLIAAFALAIFFPAVHFSRFAIRGMLLLPVSSLCVHAFWRGARALREGADGILAWFAFAGLWLGLSIYTYAAGRLFPLLFLLFVPLWLGRDRARWRRFFPATAMMAGISLLVAAPLLLFYLRYPFYLTFRATFVANRGSGAVAGKPWLTWLYNVGRVARGFVWQGETHLRHNLPGRAFLDPLQASFAVLGLVAGTRDRRRTEDNNGWWLFLGLWLLLMSLPSVLSGDAPHFGRLIGAAPPLAILTGLGAELMRQSLRARLRLTPPFSAGLLSVLLVLSAGLTVRDYFGRYANHPDLPAAFYAQDWQLGQYAAQQEGDLYLSPTQEEMATLYFALADPDRLRSFVSLDAALPLGRPGQEVLYLLRHDDPEAVEVLAQRRPGAVVRAEVAGATPVHLAPTLPSKGGGPTWAGAIALVDWEIARTDAALAITFRWEALAEMQQNYTVFVHLIDADGNLIAQEDRPPAGYPTSDWRQHEWVEDIYRITLPEALPSGNYRLSTGFYYLPTMEQLGAAVVIDDSLPLP